MLPSTRLVDVDGACSALTLTIVAAHLAMTRSGYTNVQLIEAKIVTLAERVEDTFFINTESHEPLEEAQQYQLTLALKEQILI